nr:PEP-CTERM sorting domain-containing protein [Desulfobacter postgatei]
MVQSVSSSIGGAGGGIGYAGISPSVGVEFDTWGNASLHDPSSNHIGIDVNGVLDHGSGSPNTVNVGHDSDPTKGFDNGQIWYSWIDYNGTTLDVRLSENNLRPDSPILSRDLDIPNILGVSDAFVGFTSGTGADYGNHDILAWEYRDEFDPIHNQIPEPATFLLFGLGILGIAGVSRKKTA